MTIRLVGIAVTVIAVVVLLGSMILGLGGIGGGSELLPLPASRTEPMDERIRVEVLNGAGIAGLAREVTERLRAEGFDVVSYGNAGRLERDSSVILDRAANAEAAQKVADALGIPRVELAVDTTLYLEATVILAPDWEDLGTQPD